MKSAWLNVGALVAVLLVSSASAAELEQLLIRARTSSSPGLSHLDGAVYMQGNQPLCAFGVVQMADAKPQYTYFVLFKQHPDPKEETRVTGPLRSKTNQFDYQLIVTSGKRTLTIAHQFKYDEDMRKISLDKLTVDGNVIDRGASRFFLADLGADKATVTSIKHPLPEKVLDPTSDDHSLEFVRDLIKSLRDDKEISKLLR